MGCWSRGEDCPLVGKDAIGLVLVPGLAFDPSGGRLGQGGGFMTAGWRITPAVPPPCAGRRCCCPKSPAPPMTGGVELVLTEHGLYRADAQRSGAQRPCSSPDGT